MAQSEKSKRMFNFFYGIGASIVILGALFKITHFEFGFLNGSLLLTIGLVTEAIIFAISAFEPVEADLDWTLVYPELSQDSGKSRELLQAKEADSILSKKLDEILHDARLDAQLMSRLGDSIRSFEEAARHVTPTTDAINSTRRYSEELSMAASHMESLNSMYRLQVENSNRQTEISRQLADGSVRLNEQMEAMARQLANLNEIYGGILTAMSKR